MAKIPKTVKEKKMLSLYVKDSDRVALLEKVLEGRPWERSLSDAVFHALEDFSNYGPLLEKEAVSIRRLSYLMVGARVALEDVADEKVRQVVYWHVIQYYAREHLQNLKEWGHDMWRRDFSGEEIEAIGSHFEGPPPELPADQEATARELFMQAVTGAHDIWEQRSDMAKHWKEARQTED
jgi:hypothetical protein